MKKINNKLVMGIVLVMVIVFACVGVADARTSPTVLQPGDLVFINEENLNVAAILGTDYVELRTLDGTRVLTVIDNTIPAVDVYGVTFPCLFYAYNASKTDNKYGTNYIMVSDLNSLLDGIYLKKNITSGTAEQSAANAVVINTEEIQYFLKVKSAYAAQLSKFNETFPNWCNFGIEIDSAGYYRSEVKNLTGSMQNVVGANPTDVTESAKFTYYMNDLKTGQHSITLRVKMNLPTITDTAKQPELKVYHTVRESSSEDFSISASKTSVEAGDTGLLVTLKGLSLKTYTVSIVSSSSATDLTFPTGISSPQGTIVWVSDTQIKVTFGDSGSIVYPIRVDENATRGEYHVYMADETGNAKSVKISVTAVDHIPSISIPDDVANGKFASGDSFKITIKYEHPKTDETVSLYLRSGTGSEVLLMSGMTFAAVSEYTYTLSTRGFDAGTYTLIARGSEGGTARVSFYLSTPTLVVRTNVPESGILEGEQDLEITYNARGSPDKLVWYLFGTNLRKAGTITLIPEGTADEGKAHIRTGTFFISADELEGFDDGNYYLVVEHPGSDNNFTLTPHCDATGNLESVTTQNGASIGIENRQAANAAAAIVAELTDSLSDDLYVQEGFEIQRSGYLRISGIASQNVGSASLSISGVSSAPAGTTVNLAITPVSFTPSDVSNTAMQMKAGYSATLSGSEDTAVRTFTISGISIASWYPGTYLAEVSMDDPKLSRSVSFVIGADGSITSADVKVIESSGELYYYTGPTQEPTPLPTTTKLPTMVPTATPKNSLPVIGGLLAMAAACLVARRR